MSKKIYLAPGTRIVVLGGCQPIAFSLPVDLNGEGDQSGADSRRRRGRHRYEWEDEEEEDYE